MNVIFLDFDGVLVTLSDPLDAEHLYPIVEKRIMLLAEICKEFNCKIVIEASAKDAIDEETMEIYPDSKWVQFVFSMFEKYGIECIGRTPNVSIKTGKNSEIPMWKEDEIRLYLFRHPEIEHYCVLDDDDITNLFRWKNSDLKKVKDHLVSPLYYVDAHPEEEGLLPKHKEQIGEVLKKENKIRQMVLNRKNIKGDNIWH